MKLDTHKYVQNYHMCLVKLPLEYATLFYVAIAPQWSRYILDYLQEKPFPQEM